MNLSDNSSIELKLKLNQKVFLWICVFVFIFLATKQGVIDCKLLRSEQKREALMQCMSFHFFTSLECQNIFLKLKRSSKAY